MAGKDSQGKMNFIKELTGTRERGRQVTGRRGRVKV